MTIFSCNNLSKSFAGGLIFSDVSFGIQSGDKIGLIGKNGIGKTTLLNIIAGKDFPDDGEIVFNSDVKIEYLEQVPKFERNDIIINAVLNAKPELQEALVEHSRLCTKLTNSYDDETSKKIDKLAEIIEHQNGWNLENKAKAILSKLNIENYYDKINTLSGGIKKRVALARALLTEPDLLILDEPTNHLDAVSVQWLQDTIMATNKSLLFVTHDRYFLDAVSTRIIELDDRKLFSYPGSYSLYLERKATAESIKNSTIEHAQSKYKMELAWLQKGAKARRSKQQSRIDWIQELEKETVKKIDKKIKIELGNTFLGKRIIDAFNIGKSIGGKLLFKDFTFLAKPGDRIGIIGPNGTGKSTLLNVLSNRLKVDEGLIKMGASLNIGYFTQDSDELKENQTLINSLKEIAEYINVGVGRDRYLTARDLLTRFLFPFKQHNALVDTLSGGEKRRLQIIRVLMANPNVLFLDEPTNDLDIPTLNALEEYLDDFYGVLLIVSHDRAFLDRTVNFIFAFEENGKIKEYPGNYSYYLEQKEKRKPLRSTKNTEKQEKYMREKKSKPAKKLSYKDKIRLEELEKTIPLLEAKQKELQELINSGEVDYKELEVKSQELVSLESDIEEATTEWMELLEKKEGDL